MNDNQLSTTETRRGLGRKAVCSALPALAVANAACVTSDRYSTAARGLRRPVGENLDQPVLLRELVRCATLAANAHNTQAWTFELSPDAISIRPNFSRRTPVVDPDEHHIWTSLGCAAENLIISGAALGRHGDLVFERGAVRVLLDRASPVRSPLANAIFRRQCSRTEYDGKPVPAAALAQMLGSAGGAGVQILIFTERAAVEHVIEYVTEGNSAQLRNPAFVKELKSWVRFNDADALATGDGLLSRTTGNPSLPRWLGNALFSLILSGKTENEKYAKLLRSSGGVAVFVGERAEPSSWFAVGRAYERFALTATSLGVRTAFVNQPVEVPAVRFQFANWLGLGSRRPDLVVRFGMGPESPYSLRRPVGDVIL
jgi:hypothetical protein